MELQLYLNILKRRAIVIAIVAVVAVLVVAAAGFVIPAVYTANTTVRVLLDVGIVDLRLRDDYSERLLNTYSYILKSEQTLEEAISRLSPRTSSVSVAGLRRKVEVDVVPDTELIAISVQDRDPALARDFANTLGTLLVEYAQNLYIGSSKSTRQMVEEQLASLENDLENDHQRLAVLLGAGKTGAEVEALARQIAFKEDAYDRLLERYELATLDESLRANSITIISPAKVPREPSNPIGLTQIGLSLILGLLGGVGLALVQENLDTRIHSPQQLEHLTNLPVLGVVPRGLLSPGSFGHASKRDSSKPIEEAYRLLSINVQALKQGAPRQTILITSAVPKEGKSMVAVNLAQALAEQGQTIVLIESDLRRPTIEKIFGIDSGLGLSNLLAECTSLSDTEVSRVMSAAEQSGLFVIGGGPEVPNPTVLLASPSVEKLLEYVDTQAQITLLNAPPVLGMADVSLLAPKVDGVILVIRQAHSKREHLLAALEQLQASQARVAGLVFVRKSGSNGWVYE